MTLRGALLFLMIPLSLTAAGEEGLHDYTLLEVSRAIAAGLRLPWVPLHHFTLFLLLADMAALLVACLVCAYRARRSNS